MAVLKVGADGKAPAGAKVGDTIVTGGGSYKITGGSDGNWSSEKVNDTTTSTYKGSYNNTGSSNSGGGYKATGTHFDASLPASVKAKIQELQKQYMAASTPSEKAALHAQAQALRAPYGYSGGDDGSEYNVFDTETPVVNGGNTVTRTGNQPALMGLKAGDMYGINYDFDSIKNLMNNATAKEYALKRQQQDQVQNQYYNRLSDTQATTLDTLRQAQAQAVATGASKGIAAANELSAMLNLQQVSADDSLQLAQDYSNLGAEEAAAYTANESAALETSNALKQGIATNIDLVKYGYDTQGDIGYLDYLAAMANVDAQKYAADKSLEATQYQTDNYNSGASSYANSNYNYNGNGAPTANSVEGKSQLATINDAITASETGSMYIKSADLYVTKNEDGTYKLRHGDTSKGEIAAATADQLLRIQNSGWDLNAGNEAYTGATVFQTKEDAEKYFQQTGKAPNGWTRKYIVDPHASGGGYYSWFANTKEENKYNDGAKVRVSGGSSNLDTVWTYDKKNAQWKTENGNTITQKNFAAYLDDAAKENNSKVTWLK